ncbi:hypothetical protein [Streptacidiphilus jiangxiensis]|uniref:BMP family ABC transporter substrate-binding protein n=1 Tax=Streptacidiphilus jiangxiensis TaxID=235985 RepID=A0A1H8AZA4_STRJI|nr:hypothetical protein [Streptacidiphilus jiangxiensis]SEM75138.1 hypothetical protein SAMN05414137_15211 [Streptacidiphilus jiangxiensis]
MTRLLAFLGQGRRRNTILLAAVAAIAAACLAAVLTFSGDGAPPKVLAADLSGRPTACLAADTATTSRDTTTTRTWTAMQHGAQGLKVNIQQLVLPATATQAKPYLAGLLAQHCNLVVTVGQPFGAAIAADAHLSPTTHFMTVDASHLPGSALVTQLDSASAPTAVQAAVAALAGLKR